MKRTESIYRMKTIAMTAVFGAMIAVPSTQAADWNRTSGGAWGEPNYWESSDIADGIGEHANFHNNITADATINLNSTPAGDRTIGVLNIGDANGTHLFNFTGSGKKLIFAVSSGSATLMLNNNAKAATHTFYTLSSILLSNDLVIANNKPGGSLNFQSSAPITENGGDRTVTLTAVSGSNINTFDGQNGFSKLVITTNALFNTQRETDDRALGKAYSTYTSDAVTLNGGTLRCGDDETYTISANRGITLAAGGGTFAAPDTPRQWVVNPVIAGTADGWLSVTGPGTVTLNAANTYNGETRIESGKLSLGSSASLSNSPTIMVAGGATFDVSGQSTTFTLGNAQTLKASGSASAGTITMASDKGVAMGATSGLHFSAYNGSQAPLTVSGTGGSLTLASGNAVTVTPTSQLDVGTYKLIAKSGSATVSGTVPSSVTVNGPGSVGHNKLLLNSGELYLNVRPLETILYFR